MTTRRIQRRQYASLPSDGIKDSNGTCCGGRKWLACAWCRRPTRRPEDQASAATQSEGKTALLVSPKRRPLKTPDRNAGRYKRASHVGFHQRIAFILAVFLQLSFRGLVHARQQKKPKRTLAASAACLSSTTALEALESNVVDFEETRVYKLCPNTVFTIGTLDFSNHLVDGQEMIHLRSNLHIQCGDEGIPEGNCILKDGSVLVEGTSFFGSSSLRLRNVVLEGLTFLNAGQHMVWITRHGHVTFRRCVFAQSRTAVAPFLMDYFHPDDPDQELTIMMDHCRWEHNHHAGFPAYPALIVANSRQNRLIVQDTRFSHNDIVQNNTQSATQSFLVFSSGPMTLVRNCFFSNAARVSPVSSFGQNEILYSENFQDDSNGHVCSFLSLFATVDDVDTGVPTTCIDFDAEECQAGHRTESPSHRPSVLPSEWPSFAPWETPSRSPSRLPSPMPSITPSTKPSIEPSLQPTMVPSKEPSLQPTTVPSKEPSQQPTMVPSKEPSHRPTIVPSIEPSHQPTMVPSVLPTTARPSYIPSMGPSMKTTTEWSSRIPSHLPTIPVTLAPRSLPPLLDATLSRSSRPPATTFEPPNQPRPLLSTSGAATVPFSNLWSLVGWMGTLVWILES